MCDQRDLAAARSAAHTARRPLHPNPSLETRDSVRDVGLARSLAHSDAADRALANALPQIIWTCDAQGRLDWVNDRWFELTGLSEEQTLNDKGALAAVHPDDHAELARRWGHALETSTPTDIEYRIRTSLGEYRWHLARVAPVRGLGGDITRWVAATLDIHDRRVAEDALRGLERRFETVFHLTPQAMTLSRQADGLFFDVNDAFVELTGYTRDEAIGKTSIELGLLTDEMRASLLAAVRNGSSRGIELSIRVKDGRLIRIVLSSARIEIDGVPCFVNVSTDVTDRRASEDALRASEAQACARADELAALMDAVPAAVWISRDPDCREIYFNRAGHEALRIPMGDNPSNTATDATPTQHFSVFVNGAEVAPDQLPLLQRAARGEESRNHEEELRFDDGQITHLYGSAVPLRDPDGAPRGAIGAFLDLSTLLLGRCRRIVREVDSKATHYWQSGWEA